MAGRKSYWEKIADHIAAVVNDQGVENVLHFTQIDNLSGILKHGLQCRSVLQDADYDVFASDGDRLDGQDGAISVSISCYYPKMFDAKRFRSGNASWVILIFEPSILWNYHCLFYRYGAATSATKYEHGKRYGGFALDRIFDDCSVGMDERGSGFREANGLPSGWPTFPEAEVQVMDPIHPDYLMGAWVETAEDHNQVRELLTSFGYEDCDVVVHPFEPRICRKPYYWG